MLGASLACALVLGAGAADAGRLDTVDYRIHVRLDPPGHRLEGTVRVHLPAALRGDGEVRFLLHRDLEVTAVGAGAKPERMAGEVDPGAFGIDPGAGEGGELPPLAGWRVAGVAAAGDVDLELAVAGVIHHRLEAEAEDYARSFSRTAGIIAEEGVMLGGGSFWLPRFGEQRLSFDLEVDLPGDWDAVSQGQRTRHDDVAGRRLVRFEAPEPGEEVYLVAGRYVEYARPAGEVLAQVFLRAADPALAARYLEATEQYLEMYRRLIGPYPYPKFALVENFWETGYGMPSFTLLGPKVIRFPFILTSSYPHEILHNWWGNSVFVDWASGNWCEGLTAYLADHLLKEGRGEGEGYRRDTLQRYADHVRAGRDFPLRQFRSRHSSASEAVGYGKGLMLFHMLRRRLGDERFTAALGRFYREERFRVAGFADLERVFSAVAGDDLGPFFRQWLERTGAPELRLDPPQVIADASGHNRVRMTLRQVQPGEPYRLEVPVAITLAGAAEARMHTVVMGGAEHTEELTLESPPLQVMVDPQFDLFRRLDPAEVPPALSQLFGAERVTIVVPGEDPALGAGGYAPLVEAWAGGASGQVEVVSDRDLSELPADRSVWVLGAGNRWASVFEPALRAYGASLGPERASFGAGGDDRPRRDHSLVFAVRHPRRPDLALGWIVTDVAAAVSGLARKLPHYGKYSWLAFAGAEPSNVGKGQWPVVGSPLVWRAEAAAGAAGSLEAREPLARPPQLFDGERLLGHVRALSAADMEGRGAASDGLERAARYVAAAMAEAGLQPGGDDGGWFQTWEEADGPGGRPARLRNVIGVLGGSGADRAGQSVVLGAHYDHLGRGWPDVRQGEEGKVHPGADDNASGVAVLLEVARSLAGQGQRGRTLVFVAFAGEEWGRRGSRHYVAAGAGTWPAAKALAMINLDTVGRLGAKKLLVLGAGSASEWPHIARGIGFTTGVDSEPVLDDPGGSDQVSFLDAGVPAVQLFSGGHDDYHRPGDTADKVDGAGLVRVATFAREALAYLGERAEPLTSSLGRGQAPAGSEAAPAGGRKVSLGTMPDFAFAGPGVRVERVMPGSPAEQAGIQAGDVVLVIDGEPLADLRGYSEALRKHAAGDRVRLRLRRGESEIEVEATLVAR